MRENRRHQSPPLVFHQNQIWLDQKKSRQSTSKRQIEKIAGNGDTQDDMGSRDPTSTWSDPNSRPTTRRTTLPDWRRYHTFAAYRTITTGTADPGKPLRVIGAYIARLSTEIRLHYLGHRTQIEALPGNVLSSHTQIVSRARPGSCQTSRHLLQ